MKLGPQTVATEMGSCGYALRRGCVCAFHTAKLLFKKMAFCIAFVFWISPTQKQQGGEVGVDLPSSYLGMQPLAAIIYRLLL